MDDQTLETGSNEAPSSGSKRGPRTKTETKKTTYNMPVQLYDQFQEIASEVGATSVTEVFRQALKLYVHLYEATKRGEDIVVVDREGKETSYKLMLG